MPPEPTSTEARDDWATLTDEDRLGIESIGAELERDYADIAADRGPSARAAGLDPADRARDRRPPVIGALAGGVLAVAVLGYAAAVLVASRTPAVSSGATPSADVSPRAVRPTAAASAAREPSGVERPASVPRAGSEHPAAPVAAVDPAVRAAAAEVTAAFRAWVDSINRRQVGMHMAWYADPVAVFYNARNVPRGVVYALRSRTFAQATRMEVQTSEPDIRVDRDGHGATMVFRKDYTFEGPHLDRRGSVVQELRWRKVEDGWRIIGERALEERTSSPHARSKQP